MAKQLERTHVDGTFRCPNCRQTWQHIGRKCGQCGERVTLVRVLAEGKQDREAQETGKQ